VSVTSRSCCVKLADFGVAANFGVAVVVIGFSSLWAWLRVFGLDDLGAGSISELAVP
jgi:hypothetical protein